MLRIVRLTLKNENAKITIICVKESNCKEKKKASKKNKIQSGPNYLYPPPCTPKIKKQKK